MVLLVCLIPSNIKVSEKVCVRLCLRVYLGFTIRFDSQRSNRAIPRVFMRIIYYG